MALFVASFATVSAARILLFQGADSSDDSPQEFATAGRLDPELLAEPMPLQVAPEPIAISLMLEQTKAAKLYLQEAGLDPSAADQWAATFAGSAGRPTFVRGHSLTLLRDPETGDLRGFKYNLDDRTALIETSYGGGVLRVSQELIRYVFRPVAVCFKLRNNFWDEAGQQELPSSIINTLDYAFRDGHPLGKLPRGSNIKLIYQEKVSRDGTQRSATGIQAAMITYGRRTLTAFAFRDENGEPRLYDTNGNAVEPQSLAFPINFQYISSGFGFHRYHPILHRYRAHTGIDLAARYGTPVKVVADGTVEEAGWCGELGRCVRIRHEGGIVSIYGHLAQIDDGLGIGRPVQVGEIIGLVGSSGLSTGPHLHYAIEKDGQFVNPLTERLGIHHQVSPRMRRLFEAFKREYLAALDKLPLAGHYSVALFSAQAPGNAVITGPGRASSTALSAPRHIDADGVPHLAQASAPALVNGRASVTR